MGEDMAVQKGAYQTWVRIWQSRKEHTKDGWRYGSPERSIPKMGGDAAGQKGAYQRWVEIWQSRNEHIKDGWRYGSPERSVHMLPCQNLLLPASIDLTDGA